MRGGSLIFEELAAREHKLRDGEELVPGGVTGNARMGGFEGGEFKLRFDGDVRGAGYWAQTRGGGEGGLEAGPKGYRRNLMPSVFDYWRSRQPVLMLWGAAGSLLGLVLTALRWFKVDL